ncbi:MAG: D-serine dehydratase [Desulfitibacter sp. BRH_c19]|nr:MAG: D-serine dehydratase [Desulfitibacter sp. BRH_c19]
MSSSYILNKKKKQWLKEYPLLIDIMEYKPVFWINPKLSKVDIILPELAVSLEDIKDAELRLERFAPLICRLFPETRTWGGIIESELIEIASMKEAETQEYREFIEGCLMLKCDNYLPVAGSIKARGGIYEVLKHAEALALKHGLLKSSDNYTRLADSDLLEFFSKYSLSVGSTGNLGLSIGIIGTSLGFKVTVHMSSDAKEWKKHLLRNRGVNVLEYSSDYSKAVEIGRKQAEGDPLNHFIDDENSKDLFLGYSVAAFRLKKQLKEKGIEVSSTQPLFVYIPCGVGGAPGGICFGLKQVFGDAVHVFFAEPTHSPCMLLGLMTGENEKVSTKDFGLDNITDADGLAVGRSSSFAGKTIEKLLSGIYTISDSELFKLLSMLKDTENIKVEPSGTPGLLGPIVLMGANGKRYVKSNNLAETLGNATHIAWATGGLFVPDDLMKELYCGGQA